MMPVLPTFDRAESSSKRNCLDRQKKVDSKRLWSPTGSLLSAETLTVCTEYLRSVIGGKGRTWIQVDFLCLFFSPVAKAQSTKNKIEQKIEIDPFEVCTFCTRCIQADETRILPNIGKDPYQSTRVFTVAKMIKESIRSKVTISFSSDRMNSPHLTDWIPQCEKLLHCTYNVPSNRAVVLGALN